MTTATKSNTDIVKDASAMIVGAETELAKIDLRQVPKGAPRDAVKEARTNLRLAKQFLRQAK